MSGLDDALDALGALVVRDYPLGAATTYRVGGLAAGYVAVTSQEELNDLCAALRGSEISVVIIGNGSNLLVADRGFDGVAIHLGGAFADIGPGPDGAADRLRAGGGCPLPVLARRSVEAGYTGLEWAVGVPGTVGGACAMNAGGHGSDTASVVARCGVVNLTTGTSKVRDGADLDFGYRSSALGAKDLVCWAEFELAPGEREAGRAALADIVRWRRANQPGGANAGSVFTNPPDDSAGRLIDAAGCKGWRHGSAEVSTKHANFIQADAGGSADDVAALIGKVRAAVTDRFGITLVPEVRMIGFAP